MEIFANNIRNKYSSDIFVKYIPWEYLTEIFDRTNCGTARQKQ